eukprot:UN3591
MRGRVLEADTTTRNAAVSACGKGRRWIEAFELVSSMRHLSGEADVVTHNALGRAVARGQQWACAVGMLPAMRRAAVEPDVITHVAILDACEYHHPQVAGMDELAGAAPWTMLRDQLANGSD